uniref:Uncharacterized protein n=1 Tax=Fagus sylvatica TaxID=28930 RepID=A0A2N9IV05_FAGSY
MWRSKDHRSAGLWWSLLSSGGGHGSLGCDFFVSVGAAVDQSVMQSTATSGPCIILPRHLLHHPSQLAPPQTVLVAGFGCEPLGNLRWTTRWRGGPVPSSFLVCRGPCFPELHCSPCGLMQKISSCHDYCCFGNLIFALEMFPLQCLEHRAKWEGKWCLKATFPSPFQMFQDASLCGRLRFVE